jgi:hypothetical protein
VSAERDELPALRDALPNVPWPPDWFAMGEGSRTDLGRSHDDVLAEGFGR